jgi:hypothetical protein
MPFKQGQLGWWCCSCPQCKNSGWTDAPAIYGGQKQFGLTSMPYAILPTFYGMEIAIFKLGQFEAADKVTHAT